MAEVNAFFEGFADNGKKSVYEALDAVAQLQLAKADKRDVERIRDSVWTSRRSAVAHWRDNVWGVLKDRGKVQLFEALSSLNPLVVAEREEILPLLRNLIAGEEPEVTDGPNKRPRWVTGLKSFTDEFYVALCGEFPEYKKQALVFAPTLRAVEEKKRPAALWKWWGEQGANLRNWKRLMDRAALIQPSSAAIERFFSILKQNSTKRQFRERPETQEVRAMCLYTDMQREDEKEALDATLERTT